MSNFAFKELLEDPDTPATVLNIIIIKEYGGQVYNWELETIWLSLIEDFDLKEVNSFTKEKISAVLALNTSEQYYQHWETFENINKAFNSQTVHFEDLTPLTAEELAWGIVEAKLNDATFSRFSGDVTAYIQTVFKSEGVSRVPDFLAELVDYKPNNSFTKDIEAHYQHRIRAHVLLHLDEIAKICRDTFNYDFSIDIRNEFPMLGIYLQ